MGNLLSVVSRVESALADIEKSSDIHFPIITVIGAKVFISKILIYEFFT